MEQLLIKRFIFERIESLASSMVETAPIFFRRIERGIP